MGNPCPANGQSRTATIAVRASTPWSLSQHAVLYADGIVVHSAASQGGLALSPVRNRLVPPLLRAKDGFYQEDYAWVAVTITFPVLLTDFERRHAHDILLHAYSQSWKNLHCQVLQPDQSRGKDRRHLVDEAFYDRSVRLCRRNLVIADTTARRASLAGPGVEMPR